MYEKIFTNHYFPKTYPPHIFPYTQTVSYITPEFSVVYPQLIHRLGNNLKSTPKIQNATQQ